MSSAQHPGYVMLNPPLRCRIQSGLLGRANVADDSLPESKIAALATDRVLLEGPLSETSSGALLLHVTFEGQKDFVLEGNWARHDGRRSEVLITSERAKADLFDLMGLVRKGQHIAICATQDVEASDRYTGFSDVTLRPKALPELAWQELDTSVSFLGRSFPLPLLITGMTGGLVQGAEINRRLALAAQHFGIPMGVGSQRVALENPEHAPIFAVKSFAPKVFLIGNVGIAQLRTPDAVEKCRRAVAMIQADALAIHVNVLQEVVQVEGDKDFRDVLPAIASLTRALDVPVIIKEVGCGVDVETARRLVEAGVAAIDCGGKGGTSWSLIEGVRAQSPITQAIGSTFRDWGIPTGLALAALHQALPELPLIATGGVRDGLTVAKAVGLGARFCGIGLPIFKAALASEEAPFTVLETFTQGLRTAMICSGARRLADLKARLMPNRGFRDALQDLQDANDPVGWSGHLGDGCIRLRKETPQEQ